MQHLKYLTGYPAAAAGKSQKADRRRATRRVPREALSLTRTRCKQIGRCTSTARSSSANTFATREQIDKVTYDSKLDVVRHALGLHTSISRVQGGKLKAKKEIRIASLFREAAPEFLKMIVVHELAHLKESDHNKAFYRLCEFMQPGYHQIEFDLRLYLTHRDLTKNQT